MVLGGIALVLGWRPAAAGVPAALLVLALGTVAFTALGLLLAGTLRAEGVLAAANLVWVLLLVGGGVVLPPDRLGAWGQAAGLLPSGALGDGLRAALVDGAFDARAAAVLVVWGAAAAVPAARFFRWD
jgi:ABC-2 type transport system permease protein